MQTQQEGEARRREQQACHAQHFLFANRKEGVPVVVVLVKSTYRGHHFLNAEALEQGGQGFVGSGWTVRHQQRLAQGARRQIGALGEEEQIIQRRPVELAEAVVLHAGCGIEQTGQRMLVLGGDQDADAGGDAHRQIAHQRRLVLPGQQRDVLPGDAAVVRHHLERVGEMLGGVGTGLFECIEASDHGGEVR